MRKYYVQVKRQSVSPRAWRKWGCKCYRATDEEYDSWTDDKQMVVMKGDEKRTNIIWKWQKHVSAENEDVVQQQMFSTKKQMVDKM